MLQANKAHVIAAFTRQNLNLRQLELQYWMDVLKKFATLGSFLGGFASTVVQLQKGSMGGPVLFQLIFSLTAAGALGFNFIVVVICTTCIIWGPGKALTGQGEASSRAVVETLERSYRLSLIYFRLGSICYLLSTTFASFCLFSFFSACLICLILFILFILLIYHLKYLKIIFVPKDFNSAALKHNPFVNIGEVLTKNKDKTFTGYKFDIHDCSYI